MMRLREIYNDIQNSMGSNGEYAGKPGPFKEYNQAAQLLDANLARQRTWRLRRARVGLLEDNAMVIGAYSSGLIDTITGDELTGLVLFPVPSTVDRSAAVLERSGRILAVYEHLTYSSFCELNTPRNETPQSREDLFENLLVGPLEIDASRGLAGAEIAVRYLIEAQDGIPIGFSPSGA